MVLVGIWMQNYRNGFAWSWSTEDPGVLFNWHPLFMTIGLIYLYGNGKIYAVILKLHILQYYLIVYVCTFTFEEISISLLGILVYRMLRSGRKKYLKWSHSGIMMLSFVLSVIALLAVFDSNHRFKHPVANLYTLHSWFGISAVALFAFQVYLKYL